MPPGFPLRMVLPLLASLLLLIEPLTAGGSEDHSSLGDARSMLPAVLRVMEKMSKCAFFGCAFDSSVIVNFL